MRQAPDFRGRVVRRRSFTIVPMNALETKSTAKIMALCLAFALAQLGSSQTGAAAGKAETSAVSATRVAPSTAPLSDVEMADRVRQEFRLSLIHI